MAQPGNDFTPERANAMLQALQRQRDEAQMKLVHVEAELTLVLAERDALRKELDAATAVEITDTKPANE